MSTPVCYKLPSNLTYHLQGYNKKLLFIFVHIYFEIYMLIIYVCKQNTFAIQDGTCLN